MKCLFHHFLDTITEGVLALANQFIEFHTAFGRLHEKWPPELNNLLETAKKIQGMAAGCSN
jgi:hypothetical protein